MAQVEDILGILTRWQNIYLAKGGNSNASTDSITAYIASGANLIGKVGIDQTTAGVTDAVSVKIPTSATDTWSNSDSVAYTNSQIAKASSGILRSISGYNSGQAQWIQVHNTATLPSDTAVPVIIFLADANSNFSYDAPREGKWFSTGITICNSTTDVTKTIGLSNCWFNILYR